MELISIICATVAIYATIRAVFEPNTLKKLPYINVMNFSIAGAIALILPHPLTLIASIAYFVGATLEANAIASTFAKVGDVTHE